MGLFHFIKKSKLKFSLQELEKKLPLNFGIGNQFTVIVQSVLDNAVLYIRDK